MSERALVVLCLIASWLVLGCSGELLVQDDDDVTGDDDDAVGDDDDAVGDDDDAVGDDDDAVGDDDDAVGDDDDVADDDDVTDDDDDDDLPAQAGIVFTIPSGDMAGTYEYFSHPFCGQDHGSPAIWATEDNDWDPGLELWFFAQPQPNEHITWDLGIDLWDGPAWGWAEGGPDCWFDTGPESWPNTTGFFECADVHYQSGGGPPISFDIVDGAVRCP